MKRLVAFVYYLSKAFSERRRRFKSLPAHIKALEKSGYTKTVFDMDGHTIIIESHKHVEDNRA